jgi:hypothetical protein
VWSSTPQTAANKNEHIRVVRQRKGELGSRYGQQDVTFVGATRVCHGGSVPLKAAVAALRDDRAGR